MNSLRLQRLCKFPQMRSKLSAIERTSLACLMLDAWIWTRYERSFELRAKSRVAEMRVELLGDCGGGVAE